MHPEETKHPDLEVELERLIHEPARLKIMAYLYLVRSADFVFLISRTGLTMGNLSAHMSKLEKEGYIEVEKEILKNRSHTLLSLTEKGRIAFENYRSGIQQILGEL
jgi:DNA-binding MarR family transcriptional regulator